MRSLLRICGLAIAVAGASAVAAQDISTDYLLLATTKTSTMQKELNEAAARGFRVVVGSGISGNEISLIMSKVSNNHGKYQYKLIATTRTRTFQKELNEISAKGFRVIPTTFTTKERLFGSEEILIIAEKDPDRNEFFEYLLLATSRTSTLQKELRQARSAGYRVISMTNRGEHMVLLERIMKN